MEEKDEVLIPFKTGLHSNLLILASLNWEAVLIPFKTGLHSNENAYEIAGILKES